MFSVFSLLCINYLKFYSISLVFCLRILGFRSFLIKNFRNKIFSISYFFSGDKISFFLCILTLWISLLMFYSTIMRFNLNVIIFFLNFVLIISFLCFDFLLFFVFFELSLLPTLLLILGWGYQPERLMAGSYIMIYTFIGSLPLLFSIIYLNQFCCSSKFILWSYIFSNSLFLSLKVLNYRWLRLFLFLGFFIKLPVFGLHLWLPKAHVEAPVIGSMILAGVLLKLGSYGLFRLCLTIHFNYSKWSNFIRFWCCFSLIIVSLICFRQNDLKLLVAYSSVRHMTMIILGIIRGKWIGLIGCLLMSISHGLTSSGLFFKVKILYLLSKSRNVLFKKGFIVIIPYISFFFFVLCVSKCSAPPSLNLFSELFIIFSSINFRLINLFFFFFSVFIVGLYSIYLYVIRFHGKWSRLKKNNIFFKFSQIAVLLLHTIPVYLLFFFMERLI